jgi:chitinase
VPIYPPATVTRRSIGLTFIILVDFDWEYPGAPDRGGKKEDTENYVFLLQAVREAFDNSDGTYGISFTAPSSYWYLQWFDLPGMIQYADWINLMSTDSNMNPSHLLEP